MPVFFSVVIPLYNKGKHIEQTLESAFAQTFSDFEIIVVDDGSTDGSLDIVNAIKDPRLRVFSTENQGVSKARNFGVDQSKADHIAFLDADDLWFGHHLQDLKNLIEDYPDCGLYCKAYEKDYFGYTTIKGFYKNVPKNFRGIIEDYFLCSLVDSVAWTSAVALPKQVLNSLKGFDNAMRSGQDTDLWINVALNHSVAFDTKISAHRKVTKYPHLSTSKNRIDRLKIVEKNKAFEDKYPSLKTYLDKIRFSISLDLKKQGNHKAARWLVEQIASQNLSFKQRSMLKLPSKWLEPMKRLQLFLVKNNIYLSPFR